MKDLRRLALIALASFLSASCATTRQTEPTASPARVEQPLTAPTRETVPAPASATASRPAQRLRIQNMVTTASSLISVLAADADQPQLAAATIDCRGLRTYSGPAISSISLTVNGSAVEWYWNTFLTGNPDAAHYNLYAPAIKAAPTNLEQAGDTSGSATTVFGRNDLQLASVSCTSRYGGSIRLRFKSTEDVAFDVFDASHRWDLEDFTIDIYVTPRKETLVHSGTVQGAPQRVEMTYSAAVRYDRATGAVQAVPAGQRDSELDIALATLSTPIANGAESKKLASGLVKILNAPLFSTPNQVLDAIQISDGSVTAIAHQGVRRVLVQARVNGINVNTEGGSEEFFLTVYEGTGYGFEWRRLRELRLDQNESSSWFTVAEFPATACSVLHMHYDLVERDDAPIVGGSSVFTQPDYFDVRPHNVQLDCSTAGTAASGTRLAEVRVDGTEVHTENTVYDLQGYLSTSYRATVLIR